MKNKIKKIGDFLRELRLNRGDNLIQMAKKLDMSTVELSKLENGNRGLPYNFDDNLYLNYDLNTDEKRMFKELLKDLFRG